MSKENQENVEPIGVDAKKNDIEKPIDREKVGFWWICTWNIERYWDCRTVLSLILVMWGVFRNNRKLWKCYIERIPEKMFLPILKTSMDYSANILHSVFEKSWKLD